MSLAGDEKDDDLDMLLRSIRDTLGASHQRLVTAESCTAGLVAAQLGRIPGISETWCGSLVAYRPDSKFQWLGIDKQILEDPSRGPVSEDATRELAISALARTPEATIAAAVTGHLGPNSPPGLDGHVYTAVARSRHRLKERDLTNSNLQIQIQQADNTSNALENSDADKLIVEVQHHRLRHLPPQSPEDWVGRERRQKEAAQLLFRHLHYSIS